MWIAYTVKATVLDPHIHLEIEHDVIRILRIAQQPRDHIHPVVPILHQRHRIIIGIDPVRGYLHHILIRGKIGPGRGMMTLNILPVLYGGSAGAVGGEIGRLHHIGQLNVHKALSGFIRYHDIDATSKWINDLREGIFNREGIRYPEKSFNLSMRATIHRMRTHKNLESFVDQSLRHLYNSRSSGGQVISSWAPCRCIGEGRACAIFCRNRSIYTRGIGYA